jgi:hypothetical protein
MSVSEQKKEDWMNSKWRPMMGWMYMVVCICDFVLFPILWSLVQALHGGRVETQWSPITLNGAGLFHMAMGAILGIAAYGRTQEKLGGVSNSSTPIQPVTPNVANTTNFTPVPSWGTTPIATTTSGKKVVPDEPQPAI